MSLVNWFLILVDCWRLFSCLIWWVSGAENYPLLVLCQLFAMTTNCWLCCIFSCYFSCISHAWIIFLLQNSGEGEIKFGCLLYSSWSDCSLSICLSLVLRWLSRHSFTAAMGWSCTVYWTTGSKGWRYSYRHTRFSKCCIRMQCLRRYQYWWDQ